MVEEIKPGHDAVLGVESLHHLLRHFLNIANQGIVGCPVHFIRVDGAFQRVPIGTQGRFRFLLGSGRLFFGRQPFLRIQEHKTGSRHVASLPRSALRMVHFCHASVGCIDHLWRRDGEVEHLDGKNRIDKGLSLWIVGACHQSEQFFSEIAGDDFEVLKNVARGDMDFLGPLT